MESKLADMPQEAPAEEKEPDNSTMLLGMGAGLGAFATATTLLFSYTCPVCIVAAPALIATGVYRKIKNGKQKIDGDMR